VRFDFCSVLGTLLGKGVIFGSVSQKPSFQLFNHCRPNPANKYYLSTRLGSYKIQTSVIWQTTQLCVFASSMVVQLANAQQARPASASRQALSMLHDGRHA